MSENLDNSSNNLPGINKNYSSRSLLKGNEFSSNSVELTDQMAKGVVPSKELLTTPPTNRPMDTYTLQNAVMPLDTVKKSTSPASGRSTHQLARSSSKKTLPQTTDYSSNNATKVRTNLCLSILKANNSSRISDESMRQFPKGVVSSKKLLTPPPTDCWRTSESSTDLDPAFNQDNSVPSCVL